MSKELKYSTFALVFVFVMSLFFIFSCTVNTEMTREERDVVNEFDDVNFFNDAVDISNFKADDQEVYSSTLPQFDVSTIFSVSFGKRIQSSSVAGNVRIYRENPSEVINVDAYLSDDGKTLYIKPTVYFMTNNSEVFMVGLKPGFVYKIVVSKNLKFTDNTSLGKDFIYFFKTKDLDYGIYWLSKNGKAEKFVPGRANRYFSPNKPSVLYIHGWEKNTSIRDFFRENPYLLITKTIKNVNTGQYWVDKGYNIGIFYWDQFADENEVKDAEAKIWSYMNGYKGMRYRLANGNYVYFSEQKSVSDLLFDCYVSNFKNYSG
ncbi:MAG: Ig-like domain-containing protein, partial [Fervidobacterium sp.]